MPTACHPPPPPDQHEGVRLILELGADPNLRDPTYDATPPGWALHHEQHDVAECLRPLTSGGVE